MNRDIRRTLGVSKDTSDKMDAFNSPCTIKEAVQIARGTAEDVINDALADYQSRTSPLQIAVSLQVEILKEAVIKAGLITEDEFKATYIQKAEEFNKLQANMRGADNPKMDIKASDIEVKTED